MKQMICYCDCQLTGNSEPSISSNKYSQHGRNVLIRSLKKVVITDLFQATKYVWHKRNTEHGTHPTNLMTSKTKLSIFLRLYGPGSDSEETELSELPAGCKLIKNIKTWVKF
jgi:hypothetical protein